VVQLNLKSYIVAGLLHILANLNTRKRKYKNWRRQPHLGWRREKKKRLNFNKFNFGVNYRIINRISQNIIDLKDFLSFEFYFEGWCRNVLIIGAGLKWMSIEIKPLALYDDLLHTLKPYPPIDHCYSSSFLLEMVDHHIKSERIKIFY